MNIVFVHYHFRSGGVTSVIERQIKSLNGLIKPLLLIGEAPEIDTNIPYIIIPSLSYDRDRNDNLPYLKIAESMLKVTKEYFGKQADIFHIHNPTLGKNKDFIKVINWLINRGQNVLLQIHDFAEDGRAVNYQHTPYPSNVHYAVLNGRDYKILTKSGLKSKGLHLIPNPIEMPDKENIPYSSENNNLILYPVRAIRRKNIGEAILISIFSKNNDFVGITLEPTSKIDIEKYDRWKRFVRDKNLNVQFRMGIESDFIKLVKSSKVMITTSIKEGFGMSFLEPWVYKRMLLGRRLTEICKDFSSKGIDLSNLYNKLLIPVEIIDMNAIKEKIVKCYLKNLESFGIDIDKDSIEDSINSLFSDKLIDFGILDEENQMKVINTILKAESLKREIMKINKKLEIFSDLDNLDFNSLIEKNSLIIKREYSFKKNRELLINTYRSVLEDKVEHSINKGVLIREFNSLASVSLLLCDERDGK